MSAYVKAAALLMLLGAIALGFFHREPRFPTDITEFLPVDTASSQAAMELTHSGLSQKVVLLIGGVEPLQRRIATKAMAHDLEESGLFRDVSVGPPDNLSAIHDLYFPHRYDFVEATQSDLNRIDTDDGMKERASAFLGALNGRYSMFLQRQGANDPLLAYVGILDRLTGMLRPEMQVVDGYYETSSGESVIFAELDVSPFDSNDAKRVDDAVGLAFKKNGPPDATMTVSGVYRYTKEISTTIRTDIQRITWVSLAGVLFIFGVVFGRMRYVLLPLISIGTGAIAAFVLTSLILGEIHLIALAFGASLIGVCVDYSIHFLNHPQDAERSVWPSVLLGGLTTLAGFSVLLTSSVPALHQVAVFAMIGVSVSVATTWLLTRRHFQVERTPRHERAVVVMAATFEYLRQKPIWGAVLAFPVFFCVLLGLPDVKLEKDMGSIRDPLPELRADDETVRRKITGDQSSSVVIVRGADAEAALQRNDQLASALKEAVNLGEVQGYSSLNNLVWSERTQLMNRAFLNAHGPSLIQRMSTAFDEVGVEPAALEPIQSNRFVHPPNPLTLADIRDSELGSLVELFDARKDGTVLLTYLDQVEDPKALEDRVATIDGAFWFRQHESLDVAWRQLGYETTRAAVLGLILIALITIGGFRKGRLVVVALGPPVLGSLGTLGLFGMMGIEFGPIHGLGLMLVIALAADYGVMLASHHRVIGPPALSIMMAYLSTLLSFGALGLSSYPLLRSFGMTIAVGATFALLLLPLSDLLNHKSGENR